VLNEIGIGHYVNTVMPGEIGNFAVAAHRGGFGGAFREIDKLTNGDRVYLETKDTWFIYKFLETEIVLPTDVGVIAPVPVKLDGSTPGSRYLTMTSCTPIFVNTERIISWFELERTQSTELGMPRDLKIVWGSR
jgi:sortase A